MRCEIGCTWKGSLCSALILAADVLAAGAVAVLGIVVVVAELGIDIDGAAACGDMPTGPNSLQRHCIRPGSSWAGVHSVASMGS